MAEGAKKGVLGVAAIAGLFGLRAADDCARLGARGARAVGDDVVSVGARTGDAVLGPGARLGDDAADAAARISWGPVEAGAAPKTFVGDDGLVDALVDGGVDVSLELLKIQGPDDAPSAASVPSQVRCPSVTDLTLEPGAWAAYLDGLGIACTPKPFIGRARGETLEVDGAYLPVATLMQACVEAGGTCMLIGCEGNGRCFTDVHRAMLGHLRREYAPYVREVAGRAMAEATPAWVAYMAEPGVVTVLRRSPADATPARP